MTSPQPIIVWFRDDLRLSDHPALHAAAKTGAPVVCLYVSRRERRAVRARSAARRAGGSRNRCARWQASLQAAGAQLVLRRGDAAKVIAAVAREAGAERGVLERDRAGAASSRWPSSVEARSTTSASARKVLPAISWSRPGKIRNKENRGLRVFTPFWRRVQSLGDPPTPLPAPKKLAAGPKLASDALESWQLEPTRARTGPAACARPGRPAKLSAHARLKAFLENVAGYASDRDRPDRDGTSGLSPHLRFGEISPRQVWHAARFAAAEHPRRAADIDKFLSELGWREFCRHLLFDVPDLAERNLQPSFDAFPWKRDDKALRAWQRGQTGYPIVDAGMRELWHTGVMHNRVRMVVASFLVKHLLIDWRDGEKWFWDTLVDADAGSNPANWQWVAGSGADAAPYFRVFNPILQGEKFDPDGDYVRRWVPELAKLPNKLIHQPWEATPLELASAGVELGKTYPQPIVDHKAGRERALKAYATTRGG